MRASRGLVHALASLLAVHRALAVPSAATAHWTHDGAEPSQRTGAAVLLADVDGDGLADVIAGQPGHDASRGRVLVFRGAHPLVAVDPTWILEGEQPGDRFGEALAAANFGDPGVALVVGAPGASRTHAGGGRVSLHLGGPDGPALLPTWAVDGPGDGAAFGSALAVDWIDGDGQADVAIGAPGWSGDRGAVVLHAGASGAFHPFALAMLEGAHPGARFGAAIALDAGIQPPFAQYVLAGAPREDGSVPDAGAVHGHAWRASALEAVPSWTVRGTQEGERFGTSIATRATAAGTDVVVGAPGLDAPGVDAGHVRLFAGTAGGTLTFPTWSLSGSSAGARTGAALAQGDVVFGGGGDVLIGVPGLLVPGGVGRASLVASAAGSLDAGAGWQLDASGPDDRVGAALSIGDVSGDGAPDALIGAPGRDAERGRVLLVLGTPLPPCACDAGPPIRSTCRSAHVPRAVVIGEETHALRGEWTVDDPAVTLDDPRGGVFGGLSGSTNAFLDPLVDPCSRTSTVTLTLTSPGHEPCSCSTTLTFDDARAPGITDPGAWQPRAPMEGERGTFGLGVIDGIAYAAGGSGSLWLKSVEAYDPATDTWSLRAELPIERETAGAVLDGRLHVVGGRLPGAVPIADHLAYDPATDSWSTLAPFPVPIAGHCVVELGGLLYLAGDSGAATYDPASDSWSDLPGASPSHPDAACAVVAGRIAVIGGFGPGHLYDPVSGTWSELPVLPLRDVGTAFEYRGRLHVLASAPGVTAHFVHDPVAEAWIRMADLPVGRFRAGAAVVLDRAFVIGGHVGRALSLHDVAELVLEDPPLEQVAACDELPPTPAPSAGDACDESPSVVLSETIVDGPCADTHDLVRTWSGLDHCGNASVREEVVHVVDALPPVIGAAPPPASAECGSVPVDLPTAVDACDPAPVVGHEDAIVPGPCPGSHEIERTFVARDRCGNPSDAVVQRIRVDDSTAPVVVDRGDVACAWPPSHRTTCFDVAELAPIAAEACSLPVTWTLVGCTSDQPDDGIGDGHADRDCTVSGSQACVRTERMGGRAEGRRYQLWAVAVDACGNESAPAVMGSIHVPRDAAGAADCPAPRTRVPRSRRR